MNLKTKIWKTCPLIPVPDPDLIPPSSPTTSKLVRTIIALIGLSAIALQSILPTLAHASSERLRALGGSSEMILDNSNAFIYPASAIEWPHFSVSLFDNWGGALYPLGDKQIIGLFFNRPTSQLETLNKYIQSTGSDVFRQLEVKPLLDLAFARSLRPSLALGASVAMAYDRIDLAPVATSARALDLRLGLRIGTPAKGVLDLSLGLLARRLQDDTTTALNQQTAGDGLQVAARYRWPLQPGLTLLPFASYERDALALAPQTRSKDTIQLGVGIQLHPALNVLVATGVEARIVRSEVITPNQLSLEDQYVLAPAWVAAGQAQVGSLLFRLALRQENWFSRTQQLNAGQINEQRHFNSTLQTQVGLGMEFGPVLLDGLLERDFLRDGPHFIGGSRHGGGIFSQLSITYRFASQRG